MAKRSASQIHVELINLRNAAGGLLYRRLTLAKALLSDREWVELPEGGGGHEGLALDRLEANCFADVCGAISLPQMLEVLDAVPDEAAWKANKYNLRRMWEEMKARRGKRDVREKEVEGAKEEAATPESRKIERLKEEVKAKVSEVDELRQDLRDAHDRIRELEAENKRLRTAIEKIQKIQASLAG